MEKSPSPICTKDLSLKRKTSIEVPIVNNKAEDEAKADASEILNGKPNKEIITKLSELMTNMDPLEHFSRFLGIPEMIFRHFKGKDLIRISEVSPCYYDFIATSKLLMENIQVVLGKKRTLENTEDLIRKLALIQICYIAPSKDLIDIKVGFHDKCDPEDYNLLKNSSRLYQNIEIKRSEVFIQDRNGITRRIGDYVTNSELDFLHKKKLDMWRLLSAIEASVERISVKDFGALSLEDPSIEIESFEELKFPKLKKLKLILRKKCGGDTWARIFLNSVAIEELALEDWCERVHKDILTKMLENFVKLKILYIDAIFNDRIFVDESWKQFQFKLKSLTVSLFRYSNHANFLNFFKSQSDYLENLSIHLNVEHREIFDVIMKMPKLKSFSFKYNDAFPENGPNKMSNSITELNLIYSSNASLKFLLDSMPKISHLRLNSINKKGFKMLKSMKRKFEKLEVRKLKGVDRKEIEEIMIENYISLEID